MREIRDPGSGALWLVVRDEENTAGPGRAILAGEARGAQDEFASKIKAPVPVIRPGDRLVVEEHTATVEAYLEGQALNAAAIGASLAVRLKIGGKVVRAVAVAPGRAALISIPSREAVR